jgi:hypothetical protein
MLEQVIKVPILNINDVMSEHSINIATKLDRTIARPRFGKV